MSHANRSAEGAILFHGHKVWYRVVGSRSAPGKLPLLCLHGGPGVAHDYLEPLEMIASSGREVIFYDQLGCGNSDQPNAPSLWTVGLFLDEIGAVREALGLSELHLFGHSWGGMLAMEYALTQPSGLASLILASAPASIPQLTAEMQRLLTELSPDVQETIRRHEEAGTTDNPAYQEAMMVFYSRHLCRVEPFPDCLNRSFEKLMRNPEVYHTMWGPSEFCATGFLKDWDVAARLNEIPLPTIITSGRHDEITPASVDTVHRGIAESRWEIFEESSHMAHLEEADRYLHVINGFLEEIEARA
ncbi:MAG TPA: proline iminopeptidase-family hydrolase [Pyrinomonadaceae bacterium]|nr:proline iminopeptidase-family hydrolase [Pyrinomonadaceae bacterium]